MRRIALLRTLIVTLIALVWAGCASVPGKVPTGQHPGRFAATVEKSVALDYLLFLPEDYDATAGKKWPLIVFLHGAGERGTNIHAVATHGPPKLVGARPDFPFVVLSPQCPADRIWDVDALDALLDDTLRRHAIDPKRVYLTGLSMGGYGSWAWSAARPERFAAVAPICGGGEPVTVWLAGGARRESLSRLPVWAFHGGRDNVVGVAESERMIDAYKRIGNKARLTVYPDAGHDSWTETYNNPALYDWFRQQTLP